MALTSMKLEIYNIFLKLKTRNLKSYVSCFRFQDKGFTLLEVIVSLGVFTIAILISLGTIFSITDAQKKAVAFQNTLDNIRFGLESMSKEMRTGYSFHCGLDISTEPLDCSGGGGITFINALGDIVTYRLAPVSVNG